MIFGNDLLIYADGQAIAACKSCEIDVETSTQENSSPLSGKWREYTPERNAWGFTASYLVLTPKADALQVGRVFAISFRLRGSGEVLAGNALCERCKITGTRGNLATGSFVFRGTGALT